MHDILIIIIISFRRLGVIFFRKDNEMQKIFLDVKEGHQPSRVKDKLETCLTSEDILNVHVAKAEFDFVFESYSYGIGSSIFCRGFQTCGTAGTIGGFVKVVTDSDSTVEQFAVMTCSHTIVCKDCKNRGVPLDKGLVFVKDNYDGTLLIGSTSVHVPECDAAIAFLNDNQREQMCSNNLLAFLTTNGTHNLINNHIYLETLCKNIQVQKLGAGTKHTSGTVVHTDVRVSDENGTGIKDVFAVVGHAESFSENGDSGAFVTSVIAEHSDIVIIYGMVIGGSPSQSDSPKLTFAVRMDKIFEQFKNLHCQLDLISLEEYIMMNSMNLHAPCPSETNNECN